MSKVSTILKRDRRATLPALRRKSSGKDICEKRARRGVESWRGCVLPVVVVQLHSFYARPNSYNSQRLRAQAVSTFVMKLFVQTYKMLLLKVC